MSKQEGTIHELPDRPNLAAVEVTLSKESIEKLKERAAKYSVGLSTYIRIVLNEHLAGFDSPNAPS